MLLYVEFIMSIFENDLGSGLLHYLFLDLS